MLSRVCTLTPKMSAIHLKSLHRFFLPSSSTRPISTATQLIERLSRDLPPGLRTDLMKTIVINHCQRAEAHVKKDSQFDRLMTEIPSHFTRKEKIRYVQLLLETYYAKPVITAHPTRVLSNEAIYRIDSIVSAYLSLLQENQNSDLAMSLEKKIRTSIHTLSQSSLLPSKSLTPQEEVNFANYCLRHILDSYPKFLILSVTSFIKHHGGEKEEITRAFRSSVRRSFKEIGSWVPADFDGAPRKTAQTMARMVHDSQTETISLYLDRLESLRHTSPRLQSAYQYLLRCKEAMEFDITFNVVHGNLAQKRLLALLDEEIRSRTDDTHLLQLTELRELLEMNGFWGGFREFVRQSSSVNRAIFDDFFKILSKKHPEIHIHMQDNHGHQQEYHALEEHQQQSLLKCLGQEAKYFATLKHHSDEFPPETRRELDRLYWVLKHQDIFRSYITSDTISAVSLKEVVVLFGFASYMKGNLHIGEMNQSPLNLLPLCETPKDLASLESILISIIEDAHLRELIIKEGVLSFVAGPSDLGKVGGIFTLASLIVSCKDAEDILNAAKVKYPELEPVKLSILFGLGGDSKRRVSKSQRQLHATFQGSDAHALAAPAAYTAYLDDVIGRPSENTLRAEEFRALEQDDPDDFLSLLGIVQSAVDGYQLFRSREDTKTLFRALTLVDLGPPMNTSSRSESKSSTFVDITKSRAIGLVNYQLMTLVLWDTFMGAESLIHFDHSRRERWPFLFEMSTVLQEIVYKIFYSIAVSDIPRAWSILLGAVPSVAQRKQWACEYADESITEKHLHHTLAHIEVSAHEILKTMIDFLPIQLQEVAKTYLETCKDDQPSHIIALQLLETIGTLDDMFKKIALEIRDDLLPRYKRLALCIDRYRANPTSENAECVVLACRGDERITAGPTTISNMRSWLTNTRCPEPSQEITESPYPLVR